MAITHDDLSLRTRQWRSDVSSRFALILVFLSVLCGLFSFVLCLAAEGSRSEANWYVMSNQGDGSKTDVCVFTSSGGTPLACAVCAFVLLAVAMFAEHAYLLVAVASPEHSPSFVQWPQRPRFPPPQPATLPDDPRQLSATTRQLTWQACFLFFATWVCFAITEVLLLIGIGVECGHIGQWRRPRPECHLVRPGLFAAAGIFGLVTVLLGVALYLTALQTQRLHREETHPPHNAAHPHSFPLPSAPPQSANVAADKTSTSA